MYRQAPLLPEVERLLRELRGGRVPHRDEPVFPRERRRNGRKVGEHMDANTISTRWTRYRRQAGIGELPFHTLRHEALTRLGSMGLSASMLKDCSGHETSRMLDLYVHGDAAATARAVKRLEAQAREAS